MGMETMTGQHHSCGDDVVGMVIELGWERSQVKIPEGGNPSF